MGKVPLHFVGFGFPETTSWNYVLGKEQNEKRHVQQGFPAKTGNLKSFESFESKIICLGSRCSP